MSFNTKVGLPLFKRGTTALKGEPALQSNIKVAEVMAETVRSALGPRNMSKMIVNERHEIMVTSDGESILGALDVQHPVAKMFVDVARSMKNEVGDGIKSAIVLASELAREASKLIDKGVHPGIIVAGYERAGEKAIEYLDGMAIPLTANHKHWLRKVAATSINCRLGSSHVNPLADIVVEASLKASQFDGNERQLDLDNVKLVKYKGGSSADTRLVDGLVLEKEVSHPHMPKRIENAKIAILTCPIEIRRPQENSDKAFPKINITEPQQVEAFLKGEVETLKDMVVKIANTGANVVVVQKGVQSINEVARYLLAEKRVMAIRYISEEDIRVLSRATGAKVVNIIDDLSPDDLGYAGIVEERRVGQERLWTFVEGCKNPKATAILIRGGTNAILCDAERSIRNALCVVRDAIEDPCIVNGGGAAETELATRLRRWGESISGKEQLAILGFANALESIPIALAQNAGMDLIGTLMELRARHSKGEKLAGIDGTDGKIVDVSKLGIWEPLSVKKQILRSAVELASIILRADFLLVQRDERKLVRKRYEKHRAVGVPPQAYKSSRDWGRLKTI